MATSNEWDSSFWIDKLAKLAEDKSTRSNNTKPTPSSPSNSNNNSGYDSRIELKLGQLINISDPDLHDSTTGSQADSNWGSHSRFTSKSTIQSDNISESEDNPELAEIDIHGNDNMTTINFSDMVVQNEKERKKENINNNNHSTVDNAGNYHQNWK